MPDEEPEFRFDFGLYGGAHFFHKEHALRRDLDKEDQPGLSPNTAGMFGARLGLHFNRWVGLEAEVGGIPTRTRDSATDMWVFAYRGSLVLNLSPRWEFQPFVEAGYGALHSLVKDEAVVPSGVYGFLHGGLGFKIGFTPWTGLRVDGRVLAPWTLLDPVIPAGERLPYKGPDWEVTGGLYINFGEIEKVHFYSTKEVVVKQQQRPPAPLGPRKRLDSDGDGIPDDADRCPDLAEDRDGYEDDDGCPDPDNDKDGVPDGLDKCPNDPEDRDGYEDHDGCPDADNDMDGIPDARDKCPDVAEDRDGFDDEDGCPDPDNDKDGVPDARDKCPNNAEKVNGYQDDDGCPDEIPAAVKKFTGVIEGINFKTGSADILPGSYVLLDRAVKVLQDYPDVALEISGHTDNRGKPDHNHDLSQRRADAVRMYFVSRGIAAERLQSIGYGQDRPIAGNRTAAGRARNRRTEFRLISPAGTPQ
jgi:OOP family OmpA-OmpF porin